MKMVGNEVEEEAVAVGLDCPCYDCEVLRFFPSRLWVLPTRIIIIYLELSPKRFTGCSTYRVRLFSRLLYRSFMLDDPLIIS